MPIRCACILPGLLAALLALAAPAAAQAPASCVATLEAFRDRLRPLVEEIGERAATCGAREDYISRIGALETEARTLRQERATLGQQADRLEALVVALVGRQIGGDSACDQLAEPRYDRMNGTVALTGRVANLAQWRGRAETLSRSLGIEVTIRDLDEQSCGVSVIPGFRVERNPDGSLRRLRFGELTASLLDILPPAMECASLGRLLSERRDVPEGQRVDTFWVASPPGAEPAVQVCAVPSRRGAEGRRLDYLEGQPTNVVMTRERTP